MVDLPTPKMGATDVPSFALCVRRQDERALECTNQYPYSAHTLLLREIARLIFTCRARVHVYELPKVPI